MKARFDRGEHLKQCVKYAGYAALLVLIYGILSDWNHYILMGLADLTYCIAYIRGELDGEEIGAIGK